MGIGVVAKIPPPPFDLFFRGVIVEKETVILNQNQRSFTVKDIGKAVATAAIWGGTAGLSYLFSSFGILSGQGAGLMFFADVLMTFWVWRE